MASADTRRVVLLGKTGAGKSSLANTLFGESNVFQVSHSANSGTKLCESKTKTVNGRGLQLIDTPGFFDTDPKSTELSPELLKCITECAPGPHAFLLVLKVEKYTVLEKAIVDLMLRYFSKDVLKYTTVVFTHGDDLRGMKIEEWVGQNEDLRNLVQRCGGRCHVIDNKYWNNSQNPYRNNQYQIEELLKTIDQTVTENRGGHYTNEMLERVDAKIQEQVALIGQSSQDVSSLEIVKRAKAIVLREFKGVGLGIGGLLGEFIGGIRVKSIRVGGRGLRGLAVLAVAPAVLAMAPVSWSTAFVGLGIASGVLGVGIALRALIWSPAQDLHSRPSSSPVLVQQCARAQLSTTEVMASTARAIVSTAGAMVSTAGAMVTALVPAERDTERCMRDVREAERFMRDVDSLWEQLQRVRVSSSKSD